MTKMRRKAAARPTPPDRLREAHHDRRLDGIRGEVLDRASRRSSKHALNDVPMARKRPRRVGHG